MSKWISVKEKLPKLHKKVLIYASYNYEPHAIMIAFLDRSENPTAFYWNLGRTFSLEFEIVSHWMALPNPPEPEGA